MPVEFGVLGTIEASVEGRPVDIGPARQRQVLAALLVDVGRPVTVDELKERVWGEEIPARAVGTLRSYLSRLRSALEPAGGGVVRTDSGYLLQAAAEDVDLGRFRGLVEEARSEGDDVRAAELYGRALRLWRGEALADADTPWASDQRHTLESERLTVQLEHHDVLLRRGRHTQLAVELPVLMAQHPLDERLAAQYLLALYGAGRQVEALDCYERIRRELAQWGADPGPALRDLHQQILRADPGLPALALPASRPQGPGQLPAPPTPFVGRSRELDRLNMLLATDEGPGGSTRVVSVSGAGGVGKTWLALRWSHDRLDRFPDGQLYVNLRGYDPVEPPLATQTVLRGFLEALGVPAQDIPHDPDARGGLFRSLVARRRLLIVLDNARDTPHVTPLLPGGSCCTVLVTSRHRLVGLAVEHGAGALPLDVLSRDDARQLLTRRLGLPITEREPEAVASLLDHCAGLPLALSVAAARAASQRELPLAVLAEELAQARFRLDALGSGELVVGLRAVLATSCRSLESQEARAFALLGLVPGPDLGLSAAASLMGLPLAQARVALRNLEVAHLVSRQQDGRFRMHDLTRLYATERSTAELTERERASAVDRLLGFYLHTAHTAAALLHPYRAHVTLPPVPEGCAPLPVTDVPGAKSWFREERGCLVAAQALALNQGRNTTVWQLAWNLDTFHQRQGRFRENAAVWGRALTAAERLEDPTISAFVRQRTGQSLAFAGEHVRAVDELTRALSMFEGLGNEDGRMRTHRSLAIAWEQQGSCQDALPHLYQALALIEECGDEVSEGHVLNAIGWCLAEFDDFEAARGHCTRALEIARRHDDRHGCGIVHDSLGHIALRTGRYEEALSHYGEALELFRGVGDHRVEGLALVALGEAHHSLLQDSEARDVWTQALGLFRSQQRTHMAALVQRKLDALTVRAG